MQIAKQEPYLSLPEQWRATFQRDRENPLRGNRDLNRYRARESALT
jgi:hypothetical protein